MSLTSIGVLTTCLLIVGAAFLLTVNVNSMVQYVEGQSEMCVYMVDGLSDEELSAAENEISAAPNVTEVTFVSAEEGLANTKRRLAMRAIFWTDTKGKRIRFQEQLCGERLTIFRRRAIHRRRSKRFPASM